MRGDEQIHRAYRAAFLLKRGPDLSVGFSGSSVKGRDLKGRNKLFEGPSIFLGLLASGNAVFHFGQCDRRNPDIPDGEEAKTLEHRFRAPFDKVDTDVRVEHDFHEKARALFRARGCLRPLIMKSSVNLSRLFQKPAQDFPLGRITKAVPLFRISTSSASI